MLRKLIHPRIAIGILLLAYFAFAIALLVAIHLVNFPLLEKHTLFRSHLVCMAFGMLGAVIASIRRYYHALITEEVSGREHSRALTLTWGYGCLYYYITRPLLGGVLAALVYMLSFVGVQVMVTAKDLQFKTEGLLILYAVAFLAGFSVTDVLNRIETVATSIFRKDPAAFGSNNTPDSDKVHQP